MYYLCPECRTRLSICGIPVVNEVGRKSCAQCDANANNLECVSDEDYEAALRREEVETAASLPVVAPPPADITVVDAPPVLPVPHCYVSGIQPTGSLHLGNYAGAIEPHLRLQYRGECWFFIADRRARLTMKRAYRQGRVGYKDAKEALLRRIVALFTGPRRRSRQLVRDVRLGDEVLRRVFFHGSQAAEARARATLYRAKEACGLSGGRASGTYRPEYVSSTVF